MNDFVIMIIIMKINKKYWGFYVFIEERWNQFLNDMFMMWLWEIEVGKWQRKVWLLN